MVNTQKISANLQSEMTFSKRPITEFNGLDFYRLYRAHQEKTLDMESITLLSGPIFSFENKEWMLHQAEVMYHVEVINPNNR